jgi:hypothetical protein
MKAKTLLVAAVMFFCLTAAAFAQVTFSVGSTPVTTVTRTGFTEKTGDITFTNVSGVGTTTALGTFTVYYGVQITNTGYRILPAIAGAPTITNIDRVSGFVVINVPAGYAGDFKLTGVRVAIYGTAVTSLAAQISGVNNYIVAGQTNPTVITAIGEGLVASSTAGVLNLLNGTTTTQPVISVKEGYLNAFGIIPAGTNDQTHGNIIRFTLSALPPVGYTITFPATATTTTGTGVFTTATVVENSDGTTATAVTNGAAVAITSTSPSLKVFYMLTSDSDPTTLETLTLTGLTLSYSGSLPVPTASITWTATLAPIGVGLTSAGAIPTTHWIPRYAAAEVGPGTLVAPPTGAGFTDVLIPFASRVGSSGYDTGIAVSNTTADPGTTVLGYTGAVLQTGAIKFYFYNAGSTTTAPTSFTYTTAAGSPGVGLNALGQLPPGATYAVLLHQLIVASQGIDLDFNGYVIVVTGFGNAHVQYMLTDFKGVANGGQGLIINAARTASEALMH